MRSLKMIKLISVIIFCSLASFTKADYCQDNFTLADFPNGILKEVLSLVILGTIQSFAGCGDGVPVSPDQVKLWYYSRENPTTPVLLNKTNPIQIDPRKQTILLIPGWLCNVTNDRMPELRDAYLTRYDANIITTDWTAHSINLYTHSFCAIPNVAAIIGSFLCSTSASSLINLRALHVVGHSMGAQISGFVGQETQKQCAQLIGRITGLDPAGPLFQTEPESERLSKTDAAMVDVIHTNMAFLGYYDSCGIKDFYPNCGTFQPGCLKVDRHTSVEEIINLPISVVSCNHLRSTDFFRESILGGAFTSKSCKFCPGLPIVGPCMADILWPSYSKMGEYCSLDDAEEDYYLTTNNKSPYSMG